MKNVKMKLLSLTISAATLMSSTSVFAASNTKNASEKTQTTVTTGAAIQTSKPSTVTPNDYDHTELNYNTGNITVHYNGWVASCNIFNDVVGYGYTQSGDKVKCAQLLLEMKGYSLITDSVFGTQTYNAVKSYQASHGLTQDGVVGQSTWKSLVGW